MICGLGPFELLMFTGVFVYMYYNVYMLWKEAHMNRGQDEE
jgi:hypothetical protein